MNALGTFNVLEATRAHAPKAAFLYSSTNKVYGGLEHLQVEERGGRWQYRDHHGGVAETETLDFHSPYGCSKGAADQYVRDYARIYGLRTVVLRQSCIYGRRQFGVEDQGWVAWFTIPRPRSVRRCRFTATASRCVTCSGFDDLIDRFTTAIEKIDRVKGGIFNIGGGPHNQMSLHELLAKLTSSRQAMSRRTRGGGRATSGSSYATSRRRSASSAGSRARRRTLVWSSCTCG